jgi:hypothetical protein
MVDTSAAEARRELAHRRTSGIEVTLFWRALDDRLTLRVCDSANGDFLEYEPRPEQAMEAFHHPYAYAPHGADDPRTAARAA